MGRLGNTPTRLTNFFLDRGKSFAFDICYEDRHGAPFDITGTTTRLVAEAPKHYGGAEAIIAEAVLIDPLQGRAQFQLQAVDTYLPSGEYPYDVTLLGVSGYSSPIIKGLFVIGSNTDDDTDNTYPGEVATASQITVTLHQGATVKVCLDYADGIKGDKGDPGDPGPPTGVFVQPEEPGPEELPPNFPLWVDTDAETPPDDAFLPLEGGTMSGAIDMDGHAITDVPNPVAAKDVVNLQFLATTGHGADEIWVGSVAPPTPYYELWYDQSVPALKVKVLGAWTPITTGAGPGVDEVWVGPGAPPQNQEIWIDTDEPDPVGGGGVMEAGYYRHDQQLPATSWIVNHNLAYQPAVHVQDSVGNVLYGSIRHLSNSTLVISFTSAMTGSAHCS